MKSKNFLRKNLLQIGVDRVPTEFFHLPSVLAFGSLQIADVARHVNLYHLIDWIHFWKVTSQVQKKTIL
jgi:hypothetical protein